MKITHIFNYQFAVYQFAVHINYHIFTVICSSLHSFITNQHNDQLPVGLLAQLAGHCMVLQRSCVQLADRPEFLSGLIFPIAHYICIHYWEDHLHIHVQLSNKTMTFFAWPVKGKKQKPAMWAKWGKCAERVVLIQKHIMSCTFFYNIMTSSLRFICEPQKSRSLSIHIFKLLFLLINHS